jgi:hypothetical protein
MRARLPDREGFVQRDSVRVASADPDLIAAHITELAGKPVSYRNVVAGGAARAARLIAELTKQVTAEYQRA